MATLKTKDGLLVPVPDGLTEAEKRQAVADYREKARAEIAARAAPQREKTGVGSALAQSFGSGASMGLPDELAGAAAAAMPYAAPRWLIGDKTADALHYPGDAGERYKLARDSARDQYEQAQSDRPGTTLAGELVGGLASGIAAGGLGAATTAGQAVQALPRAAQYATLGAAGGAAAGAGYSEADSMLGVAGDTLAGGALGAAAGVALPAAGRGLGNLGGWAWNKLGKPIANKFATPRVAGMDIVKHRLADDMATADEMERRAAQLGPDAMPGEIAGPNTFGIMEAAANRPGSAQTEIIKFVNDRAARSQSGLIKDMVESLSLDDTDFYTALKESAARARQVGAQYDPILNGTKVQLTDDLKKLFKNDTMGAALKEAGENVRLDISAGDVTEDALADFAGFAQKGLENPTLRTLWYVRRGLNDVISGATDEFGKVSPEGARALKLKGLLDKELGKQSKDFIDVVKMYADEKSLGDAVRLGRKFLRDDAEITAERLAGASEAERNMFLIGAARDLRDRIMNTVEKTGSVPRNMLTSLHKEKIRTLFPPDKQGKEAFDSFVNSVEQKITFAKNKNALTGGSQTARRQAFQSEFNLPSDVMFQAGRGDTASIQGAIMRDMVKALQRHDPRAINEAALYLSNPANKKALIDILRKRQVKQFDIDNKTPTNWGRMSSIAAGQQTGRRQE